MIDRGLRYTPAALADIDAILHETRRQFGPDQVRRYAALIDRSATLATAEPLRGGSRDHGAIASGVRSLHMESAAGRRGATTHILYCVTSGRAGFVCPSCGFCTSAWTQHGTWMRMRIDVRGGSYDRLNC